MVRSNQCYLPTERNLIMKQNPTTPAVKPVALRLAVRTNLRAGLACEAMDDQAKALWDKITGAVSGAAANVATAGTADSTTSSTPS